MNEMIGGGVFRLRGICADDREKIYNWRNSPAVAEYMYTDHEITEAEHNRWFEAALQDSERRYWIMVYENEEIGLANLYDIDVLNERCCYASYIVREDLRGKGVGALAEYYILRHSFDDLGLNKVSAEVLAFNKAGINVHLKLGFRVEGLFRQHRIKNGEFADVVVLALLRSEWSETRREVEKKLKAKGIL